MSDITKQELKDLILMSNADIDAKFVELINKIQRLSERMDKFEQQLTQKIDSVGQRLAQKLDGVGGKREEETNDLEERLDD